MAASDVGVVLSSFGEPAKDALRSAADLAFRRVEMPAVDGEVDPSRLSDSGRRHLSQYVTGLGLELSALGADLGGARFADKATLDYRLDKTRQVMELAGRLRVPVVTTHLGTVDSKTWREGHLLESVRWLAELADRTGTHLAFETGGTDPRTTAELLKAVDCPLLGVCYDPASLLIDGFDPAAGVESLADRLLIARASDALPGSAQRPGRETALGQGQVDLAAYLADLHEAGYDRTTFIRRVGSERPFAELADAKALIEKMLRARG